MHFGRSWRHGLGSLLLLLLSCPAPAQIVNGTFESGSFGGWNVRGTAAIAYQGSIHAPLQGGYSALLVNTDGRGGCSDPADLWNCQPPPIPFVPTGGPALTYTLGPDNAFRFFRGSYMAQDVVVRADDTLSFDWRFIHPDVDGIRFLAIGASGWQLGNVIAPPYPSTTGEYSGRYGYRFAQSGLWTVYIGTFQTEDPTIYSVAEIDNVALQAVPEPASGSLALLGTAACGWLVRRGRRLRGAASARETAGGRAG